MSNHCGLIKRPCSNNKTPYQINELLGQHPTSHAKTLECVHPGFGGKSGADVYFIIIFFFTLFRAYNLFYRHWRWFIGDARMDLAVAPVGVPNWVVDVTQENWPKSRHTRKDAVKKSTRPPSCHARFWRATSDAYQRAYRTQHVNLQ